MKEKNIDDGKEEENRCKNMIALHNYQNSSEQGDDRTVLISSTILRSPY